jgi:hypothetical protein
VAVQSASLLTLSVATYLIRSPFASHQHQLLLESLLASGFLSRTPPALAVERLRYQERYRNPVPHPWRLCRFCRVEVEDEVHVLLNCDARSDLLALRALFWQDVSGIVGDMLQTHDSLALLVALLHDQRLTERMAKYIYVVLEIYGSAPIYIPAPYMYLPLADA